MLIYIQTHGKKYIFIAFIDRQILIIFQNLMSFAIFFPFLNTFTSIELFFINLIIFEVIIQI